MRRSTVLFLIATASLFVALAAAEKPSMPLAGVVINAAENMHSRSNANSDVVSQAILGTNVRLLKKERNTDGEDWYEVETPDTYKGWIIGSALCFLKPGDKPYASSGKIFVVSSLLANTYREDDNTKHKPVKVAPISAVLEVVRDQNSRWIEVNLPGNTRAWIQHVDGDIRDTPWSWPRMSVENLVALSKRFIGLPYLWGGTSPLGLDCSGFVQLIYKMAGFPLLLRDAEMQYAQTSLVAVPPGEETAGDLVFFGKSKDKPTHDGMMIDAEEFINASGPGAMVRISRLSDASWQKIYQGARRAKK
jgi:cell wall-associated NlpC family hydrolase